MLVALIRLVQAIKNPSQGLLRIMEQDDLRRKGQAKQQQQQAITVPSEKKSTRASFLLSNGQIDLDRLADALGLLSPTSALTVAQLIKKNAPRELQIHESPGIFEFDLSECPDSLISQIYELVSGMEE